MVSKPWTYPQASDAKPKNKLTARMRADAFLGNDALDAVNG